MKIWNEILDTDSLSPDDDFFVVGEILWQLLNYSIIRNHRIGADIVKIDPFFQYHDIAEYISAPAKKNNHAENQTRFKISGFFQDMGNKKKQLLKQPAKHLPL